MANAKSKGRRRLWPIVLLLVAAGLVAAWFSPWGRTQRGNAVAGTAYAAHVGCSCRFIAGRSMGDCAKDRLAGMELLRMSADEEAKSVTASVPLLASDTATYRKGYGCVLSNWRAREG